MISVSDKLLIVLIGAFRHGLRSSQAIIGPICILLNNNGYFFILLVIVVIMTLFDGMRFAVSQRNLLNQVLQEL